MKDPKNQTDGGPEDLAREMEEGYLAEAEKPSLDPAWGQIEVEDLESLGVTRAAE